MPVQSNEYILTSAQQAIWYAQQISDSASRNLAAYVDISGELDLPRSELAILAALEEHENLRVRLSDSDEGPVQVVANLEDWHPSYRDFTQHDDPAAAALDWAQSLANSTIQPRSARLFAVSILRVGSRRFFIVMVFNHVVIDAAGLGLLVDRISDLYDGAPVNGTSPLASIIDADNKYRRSTQRREDEQFWATYADRSFGSVRTAGAEGRHGVRCLERELPAAVSTTLLAASNRYGVTLPSVLTAIGALMISRQTDRRQFYIQIPTANRQSEVGTRPNLLANKVPLEVDIDTTRPLADWLREFNIGMLVVLEHGQLVSPEIRRAAGVFHDGSDLFGPIVNVVPFAADPRMEDSARVRPLAIGPFDYLSISLILYPDGSVTVHLEADADTFADADLQHYTEELLGLMESVPRTLSAGESADMLVRPGSAGRDEDPLLEWQPPIADRRQDTVFAAPTTKAEALLATVFSDILAVHPVGVDDNFFDLGGNSLLATKIVNRLRAVADVEIPIRRLFETQSVRALAPEVPTDGRPQRSPVVARNRLENAPLSFAQQRLWFLHEMAESPIGYNMVFALHLVGPLDVVGLSGAINDVVDRHEVLRTVFGETDGVPEQRVLDTGLQMVELETMDHPLDYVVDELASHRFDLRVDLPIAAALSTGARPDEHTLVLVAHHIAGDGWSLVPLLRDLGVAYRARVSGVAPGWGVLPVQYADYAVWQREFLGSSGDSGSVLSRQLEYWRGELAGLPDQLVLPFDRVRPEVASYRGDAVEFEISAELRCGLERVAVDAGATMSVVLQSALAVLLYRIGAGGDVPIGSPIAGRLDEALSDLVGFFVNTWVLRARVEAGMSFVDVVGQVREKALAAYEHQDVPFERVVEELNPSRSSSHHPLFQVSLAYQNNDAPSLDLPGIEASLLPVREKASRFDLLLNLTDGGTAGESGFPATLEYSTDLFDRATAMRIASWYVEVIRSVACQPDRAIGDIDLLSTEERRWLDTHRFGGPSDEDGEHAATRFFDIYARRHAHQIAIVSDEEQVTYGELQLRASSLALELRRRGIGCESVVGLALPRSSELIVALLAVLDAGAAFLPLDPALPTPRLEYMIADADPAIIITDGAAPQLPASRQLRIDRDINSESSDGALPAPERRSGKHNLAYVLYTSGSIGTPKAVAGTYQVLENRITWCRNLLGSEPIGVTNTAPGFIDSAFHILSLLARGGRVVVVDRATTTDPQRMLRALRRHRVTEIMTVPSVAAALSEHGSRNALKLTSVLLSGEPVTTRVVEDLHWLAGDPDVWNFYGSTEVSDVVVAKASRHHAPLGTATPNTEVLVLDKRLHPAPVGVVGELYVSGRQLSRGYWSQPALTATRFVAHPQAHGERVYPTGDLVRWNAEGALELVGRADNQIKIRGQRVEPAEVESALSAHPGIRRAVVVAIESRTSGTHLAAFVVADRGYIDVADELRADVRGFVASRLPDYMVPVVVMVVDGLPLTVNGKVDRSALPGVELVGSAEFREPVSGRERVLAEIFGSVLGVDRVGLDDDFFALGGHSLLATRMVARVRSVLGVEVPIRVVFDCPTVAGLAAHLDSVPAAAEDPLAPVLTVTADGARPPLWCVHPAGGVAWPYLGLERHISDRPIYALQSDGLTGAIADQTMAEVIARYIDRILAVQSAGPFSLLGWSFGGVVAHAVATELQLRGHIVELLALVDSWPADEDMLRSARSGEVQNQVEAAMWSRYEPFRSEGNFQETIARIADVSRHNITMLVDHDPPVYDGEALLFHAGLSRDGRRIPAQPLRDHWAPFVAGGIASQVIACGHDDFDRELPMAAVGRAVEGWFARRAGADEQSIDSESR